MDNGRRVHDFLVIEKLVIKDPPPLIFWNTGLTESQTQIKNIIYTPFINTQKSICTKRGFIKSWDVFFNCAVWIQGLYMLRMIYKWFYCYEFSAFTLSNGIQKQFVCSFDQNVFEKYELANVMKKIRIGNVFLFNINK